MTVGQLYQALTICIVGYSYERLDGSVRGEERYIAIKNFNQDEDTFIFLLSTRAGHIQFCLSQLEFGNHD